MWGFGDPSGLFFFWYVHFNATFGVEKCTRQADSNRISNTITSIIKVIIIISAPHRLEHVVLWVRVKWLNYHIFSSRPVHETCSVVLTQHNAILFRLFWATSRLDVPIMCYMHAAVPNSEILHQDTLATLFVSPSCACRYSDGHSLGFHNFDNFPNCLFVVYLSAMVCNSYLARPYWAIG